jgi:hypothetical protein
MIDRSMHARARGEYIEQLIELMRTDHRLEKLTLISTRYTCDDRLNILLPSYCIN